MLFRRLLAGSRSRTDREPVAMTIVLVLIAVGLGVGALVRFIKLMVTVGR
jgi:phosphate/sulfate permease